MGYDWNFSVFSQYLPAFISGTWVTVQLSVLSCLVGTIIGFVLGPVLRLKIIGSIFLTLNDMLRALPTLVLIFFFYYFPYRDFGCAAPSAFVCACAALTLSQAAYTADIVRAAVDGVSQSSIMGARSVGLKEITIWQYIILPDIFRQVLPSLIAFFIGIVRLSSLASVIGCEDVVFVARITIGQKFRSLEAWIIVAAIYIVLVLPLTWFARRLERAEWLKRR
jgi:His/Glu/Gln/Arg/opine family amino acid ABC transporter permease subunit